MLTIRLSRFGKKKHPIYRVIISEKQKDTVGDYLELLGRYDPHTNKAELKADRIKYWLDKGAQTSGTVHNLLVDQKFITGKKIKVANIKKSAESGSASGGKEKKEEREKKPEEKKSSSATATDDKEEKPADEQKQPVQEKKEEKPKDTSKKEETAVPEEKK